MDILILLHICLERFRGSICEESWFFICYELQGDGKYEYIFIPQSKTWSEAQRYCKEKYYDLATIKDNSDMQAAVGPQDFPVWIGLHRDGTEKHNCNLLCFYKLYLCIQSRN